MNKYDTAVIGGGPAGLAAAIAAEKNGAKTVLIERETRLGGILKQCIHDGFGLLRFGEKLSGPEYAFRFTEEIKKCSVKILLQSFVVHIEKKEALFEILLSSREGLIKIFSKTIILSTGCRERTARQAGIYGSRPSGVLTAGTAQYYTNILGQLPCRKCVILGSGDIGLIMARRLSLEGAEVKGVYEARPFPSGLSRNIAQCLDDFDIPLFTQKTVGRVFGQDRLEAVGISETDENMRPIEGTEKRIECDGLILSVGLIPENELAETLDVKIDPFTGGPDCDQHCMTKVPGIFSCGNSAFVNDLVDYVSESGEEAGKSAASFALSGDKKEKLNAFFEADAGFLCFSPQRLDLNNTGEETDIFFRSKTNRGKTNVKFVLNGKIIFSKMFNQLKPPEMEKLKVNFKEIKIKNAEKIMMLMEADN